MEQKIKFIVEKNIQNIIRFAGDNPNRIGLVNTPQRVKRMYEEFFQGYDKTKKPKLTTFPNKDDGVDYNQMIIDQGYFYSFCEHHMLPFFGSYGFAYIPGKHIIGLSKIARIVDWYAGKLQVQERLTKEIVDEFDNLLKPKGIMLVMKARHLCKEMRGVKKIGGEMITSEVRGVFAKEVNARQEFLQLIKTNNK